MPGGGQRDGPALGSADTALMRARIRSAAGPKSSPFSTRTLRSTAASARRRGKPARPKQPGSARPREAVAGAVVTVRVLEAIPLDWASARALLARALHLACMRTLRRPGDLDRFLHALAQAAALLATVAIVAVVIAVVVVVAAARARLPKPLTLARACDSETASLSIAPATPWARLRTTPAAGMRERRP